MAKKIFINLPVQDLNAAKAFYTVLGYGLETRFTDETAACIVVSEAIYVMLLTHDKFMQFSPKPIATENVTEALLSVAEDSRDSVDALVEKALVAGGKEVGEAEDHGFMYERGFMDLDGHCWGAFWMDMSQMVAHKAD